MDKKQMLSNLVDTSNKFFRGRKKKAFIAERQNIHTTSKYKKACNFGKLYLLPTTYNSLSNVPGKPANSNCRTPTKYPNYLITNSSQLYKKINFTIEFWAFPSSI